MACEMDRLAFIDPMAYGLFSGDRATLALTSPGYDPQGYYKGETHA
jgi:hypothetical protein